MEDKECLFNGCQDYIYSPFKQSSHVIWHGYRTGPVNTFIRNPAARVVHQISETVGKS